MISQPQPSGQSVATTGTTQAIGPSPAPLTQSPLSQSSPSSPRLTTDTSFSRPSRLGAKPLSSSFDRSAFSTHPQLAQSQRISSPPLQPQSIPSYSTPPVAAPPKPNYNISLSDITGAPSKTFSSPSSYAPPNYTPSTTIMPSHPMSSPPLQASPLSMTSMLTPMQPTRVIATNKPVTKDDWGDFDPLK